MLKNFPALLALLLSTGVIVGEDAPSFRSTPSRSGQTQEAVPPRGGPIALLRWSSAVSSYEQIGAPIVSGGRVYVGSADGKVRCLNTDDGSVLWSFTSSAGITAAPLHFKGRLFVPSTDGYLYVLHALTGEQVIPPIFHGTAMNGSPLGVSGISISGAPTDVVFATLGSPAYELRAYNAKTGAWLWTGTPGFRQISWSSAAYHAEHNRVIVGDNSGYWHCYDASTGAWRWTYRAGTNAMRNCATCFGDFVVLPGGGGADRNVHILKQTAGAPYFTIHKLVLGIPPGSTADGLVSKVGGTPEGQPNITNPQLKVTAEELQMLIQLPKADRDAHLNSLAATYNADYEDLKEWLDVHCGDVEYQLNKPETDPVSYVDLNNVAIFSSPAIAGNYPAAGTHRALIDVRELNRFGTGIDSYYTLAIDVNDDVNLTKVIWGTQLRPWALTNLDHVASPSISKTDWVWSVRGRYLEARNLSDGNKAPGGSFDVEAQILGGPVLADGRIFLTTDRGEVLCYDSGNNPPIAPTTYTPSGGLNVTWSSTPTLSWSGHFDVETPGSALVCELQYGIGYANRDLELTGMAPLEIVGGSSYQLGLIASNTHVYWRVRVRDGHGARSRWSDIQDFWISKDTAPPEPPGSISATPLAGSVKVDWTASPSPDILKYRIYHKPASAGWSTAVKIDDLSGFTHTVGGLTNGTTYDFMVTAVDFGENESPGVVASATPQPAISVNGVTYASIQAAIDAAAPGQTVVLGVGTWTGNLTLRAGVSLRGYSAKHTKIVGSGAGPVITVQGTYAVDPTSEISHLAVTNGTVGVEGATADLYVHHVAAYAINGHAITGAFGGRLRVVNATIVNNTGRGISAATDPTLMTVKNSLVGKNGGGIFVLPGSLVAYNDAWQNTPEADYGPGVDGVENRSVAVSFTDEAGGDFTEASSAAVDAADPNDGFGNEPAPNGGRRNQGAFGDTALAKASASSAGASGGGGDGGGGGGGGGGCGAIGLEFLLVFGLLGLLRRR